MLITATYDPTSDYLVEANIRYRETFSEKSGYKKQD